MPEINVVLVFSRSDVKKKTIIPLGYNAVNGVNGLITCFPFVDPDTV